MNSTKTFMKLHHVGIVVNNIQESLGELKRYLNFETVSVIMPVGSQKVNICLMKIGEPFLERIEPASQDSAITEFAESGAGIAHICYEVKNIESELESLA